MDFDSLPPFAQVQVIRVYNAFIRAQTFVNLVITYLPAQVIFSAQHVPRNNAPVKVSLILAPNTCSFEYDNVEFEHLPF